MDWMGKRMRRQEAEEDEDGEKWKRLKQVAVMVGAHR